MKKNTQDEVKKMSKLQPNNSVITSEDALFVSMIDAVSTEQYKKASMLCSILFDDTKTDDKGLMKVLLIHIIARLSNNDDIDCKTSKLLLSTATKKSEDYVKEIIAIDAKTFTLEKIISIAMGSGVDIRKGYADLEAMNYDVMLLDDDEEEAMQNDSN